jgi:hypothetical protein
VIQLLQENDLKMYCLFSFLNKMLQSFNNFENTCMYEIMCSFSVNNFTISVFLISFRMLIFKFIWSQFCILINVFRTITAIFWLFFDSSLLLIIEYTNAYSPDSYYTVTMKILISICSQKFFQCLLFFSVKSL